MNPDDRHFYFVTGKGGVGKTTVAVAKAQALARRGRRVLLATGDSEDQAGALLGLARLEADITQAEENLWAVRIDPARSVEEYGHMVLKSKLAHAALFKNRYVKSFFAALPGLYQWAVLGKVWFHSTETLADGTRRFDSVVFDAPATGHGLEMLRVPRTIVDAAAPGPLRRDAERAWQSLQDPRESGVLLVTLPEELPISEALELASALTHELELPISQVVLNKTVTPIFDVSEQRALLGLGLARPRGPGELALLAGARRAAREQAQERAVTRLGGVDAPLSVLPELPTSSLTATHLAELAGRL